MKLLDWVKLPTHWIGDDGLRSLTWRADGAAGTACLMVLIALAHHADGATGVSRLTYDVLGEATGLSRTMISKGLRLLEKHKLIAPVADERSAYALNRYAEPGWGKLPAKRMYSGKAVAMFHDFHLRSLTELNALKLFLLAVERRDDKTNMAHMTYPQIAEATGIEEARIKSAGSVLINHALLHVEQQPSLVSDYGYSNAYRLPMIDPRRHAGTAGRARFSPEDPAVEL